MKKLAGTKTESNLKAAFAGESQARGKYYYFAAKAREEGYDNVAHYFEETAVNEQEHAKIWFNFLGGVNSTKENLQAAISGEHEENSVMYPDFAKVAREEGFDNIAELFEKIGEIEKSHEEGFKLLLGQANAEIDLPNRWKCNNCGNIVAAKQAPDTCPVCNHSGIPWSGYKAYRRISGE